MNQSQLKSLVDQRQAELQRAARHRNRFPAEPQRHAGRGPLGGATTWAWCSFESANGLRDSNLVPLPYDLGSFSFRTGQAGWTDHRGASDLVIITATAHAGDTPIS